MFRAALFCLAIAAPCGLPVAAQTTAFGAMTADTKAPVDLSADSLQVDQKTGHAVFSGNVVIGQGDMRLGAQKVVVEYVPGDRRKIARLHASGNVTLVSGPDAAEAAEAVYEVETGVITLTGDVVMAQGQNVLSGNRMTVDLAQGSARVDGRVRSVLQPGGN